MTLAQGERARTVLLCSIQQVDRQANRENGARPTCRRLVAAAAAAAIEACLLSSHLPRFPLLPERRGKHGWITAVAAGAAGLVLMAGTVWLAGRVSGAAPQAAEERRRGESRSRRSGQSADPARQLERQRARERREMRRQGEGETAWRQEQIEAEQRRREWPEAQAQRAGEYERQSRKMRGASSSGAFNATMVAAVYAVYLTALHDHIRRRAED